MSHTLAPEVRLANDIARQFAHLPEADAERRIADHVTRYWDPRMRQNLQALVATGGDTMDPRVVAAAGLLSG